MLMWSVGPFYMSLPLQSRPCHSTNAITPRCKLLPEVHQPSLLARALVFPAEVKDGQYREPTELEV